MWEILCGAILGTLFSLGATIAIDMARIPRVELGVAQPIQDIDYASKRVSKAVKPARWAQLDVENISLSPCLGWIQRSPAVQCRGTIGFYHLDGEPVHSSEMSGRWTASPEPYREVWIGDQGRFRPVKVPSLDRLITEVDILPGRTKRLDIAARYDQDKECYGWNNEVYTTGWRNKRWTLPEGRHIVKVTMTATNTERTRLFRLINDVSIDDFPLVDALKEDYRRLSS